MASCLSGFQLLEQADPDAVTTEAVTAAPEHTRPRTGLRPEVNSAPERECHLLPVEVRLTPGLEGSVTRSEIIRVLHRTLLRP